MPDSFTGWVHANCPAANLQSDLFARTAEFEQRGEDFHVLFGAKTTRSGHAFLVHRFAGEYFMFVLSQRQARALDVLGPVVGFFSDGVHPNSSEPLNCHLEKAEFEQGDSVDLAKPIKGTCTCRFEGSLRRDLCLRLETELRLSADRDTIRSACFFSYPSFALEGTVQFEFAPVKKKEEFAAGQFVAAFLTVCTPPDSQSGKAAQPISNAAGVLATIG